MTPRRPNLNRAAKDLTYEELREAAAGVGLDGIGLRDLIQETPELQAALVIGTGVFGPLSKGVNREHVMLAFKVIKEAGEATLLDPSLTQGRLALNYRTHRHIIWVAQTYLRFKQAQAHLLPPGAP